MSSILVSRLSSTAPSLASARRSCNIAVAALSSAARSCLASSPTTTTFGFSSNSCSLRSSRNGIDRSRIAACTRAFVTVTNTTASTPTPPSVTALSDEDRAHALTQLRIPGSPEKWEMDPSGRNAICKDYFFGDFSQAWAFMSRAALLAEKMDHHPEWFNVYNTVKVTLTTHDCQGVSQKDIDMAKAMDNFAASILATR